MRTRLTFALGLATGYVLGTRAGRERYEQIARLARRVSEHPQVQETTGVVQAQASGYLSTAKDKVADKLETSGIGEKLPPQMGDKVGDLLGRPAPSSGADVTAPIPSAPVLDPVSPTTPATLPTPATSTTPGALSTPTPPTSATPAVQPTTRGIPPVPTATSRTDTDTTLDIPTPADVAAVASTTKPAGRTGGAPKPNPGPGTPGSNGSGS